MARDLSFWKYKKNVNTDDAEVYAKLSAGDLLESVDTLPISEIYDELKTVYSEWNWKSKYTLELVEQMIEIFMTEQFVRFDCYNVTVDNMNTIIDIMGKYQCPLYDSSISTRFEL